MRNGNCCDKLEEIKCKDINNIRYSELCSYFKISRSIIKYLVRYLEIGHPAVSQGRETLNFTEEDLRKLQDFIQKYPNKYHEIAKEELRIRREDSKPYTGRQFSEKTGVSRYLSLRIMQYYGLDRSTYVGKKSVHRYDDSDVNLVLNFIKEHPNTEEFFTKNSCQEKYGVDCIGQVEVFKQKRKQTCLERYGVENPFQSDQCKEKIKQYNLKHYGVESYTQTKECQDKRKKTCLEKYGFESAAQSDEVKEAHKRTYLEKYGNECYFKTEDWKQKTLKTLHERYGDDVDNPYQAEEVKKHIKEVMLERYGVESPMYYPEFVQKIKDAWQNKTEEEIRTIQQKRQKKWHVSLDPEQGFDSCYEIYYYCYLVLNNIPFERNKVLHYFYKSDSSKHKYICDFYRKDIGRYIELKNPAFLKEDGSLGDIYQKGLTDQGIEKRKDLNKNKLQCMIDNNVIIISDLKSTPDIWKNSRVLEIEDINFYKDWFEENCKNITLLRDQ